jgi:hypothetical protein
LLDDGAVARLVVVRRGDHLGRLAEHGTFAERTAREVVLVPPLSEMELREVVHGPAETAGLQVEPELVDAVVGDVLGQPAALTAWLASVVGGREELALIDHCQAGFCGSSRSADPGGLTADRGVCPVGGLDPFDPAAG